MYLLQGLIVFAVVASNIHWRWTEERGSQETETKNAKDACHNSLLGADRSVVNPSGRCSGTS